MPSSLTDLNTYSNTVLTYTDLRTARVVFDRPVPTNQTYSYATNVAFTLLPGINITEIILPATEQVSLTVDVSTATGATVTWPNLPVDYSVTTVSTGVYRVSNIQNKADWDIIKFAQINLANNYRSNFTLTATITYEIDKTKVWTQSNLNTQRATLTSSATLTASGSFSNKRATAALTSSSTVNCNAIAGRLYSLAMGSSMSVVATKTPGYITNMTAPRAYIANKSNQLFANDTPRITDDSPDGSFFTITFTTSNGQFGNVDGVAGNPASYNGTLAQVNAYFSQIYFWPTKNFASNTSFTFVLKKNNQTQTTRTITLTYVSTNVINTVRVFRNSQAFQFPPEELRYALLDLYIFGGGGGGAEYTSGGNGGVRALTNMNLNSGYYYFIIGDGGLGNDEKYPNNSQLYIRTAGSGQTSYATGPSQSTTYVDGNLTTASGGGGAVTYWTGAPTVQNLSSNGANGSPQNNYSNSPAGPFGIGGGPAGGDYLINPDTQAGDGQGGGVVIVVHT
jgi:hypothetical protein